MNRVHIARLQVLAALAQGPITDATGHATAELARRMGRPARAAGMANLLTRLEADGAITRDRKGTTTSRIALADPLPEPYATALAAHLDSAVPTDLLPAAIAALAAAVTRLADALTPPARSREDNETPG